MLQKVNILPILIILIQRIENIVYGRKKLFLTFILGLFWSSFFKMFSFSAINGSYLGNYGSRFLPANIHSLFDLFWKEEKVFSW